MLEEIGAIAYKRLIALATTTVLGVSGIFWHHIAEHTFETTLVNLPVNLPHDETHTEDFDYHHGKEHSSTIVSSGPKLVVTGSLSVESVDLATAVRTR